MGEENKQSFADIETNQQMTVGKINLAPYPAKNFCEWLQEQAKVQRSRKDFLTKVPFWQLVVLCDNSVRHLSQYQ